ncbi:MAG: hypothetical protein A2275_19145 [Bacteroidetes bacterium RIFOXYA12_FULL_35_11]|nr:MAG: hypothetical protein A2X01_08245 [Bacteroidetes bacterium GWF2_35_48]OFY75695.1 MAG: hypothetical protein A2275_19145 [Bacteroidetes bacterium RIFOXYA12_FULL_35_11]OFY99140.1 MAG: hypothetical protein A2491_13010 [Bacteroidetes bacterium RIFOXYC12_FULL_35_7]
MSEDKIEIRSEEVQEILGAVPRWITRWGITLIFIIFAIILFGSWVFKYPEIITAPVTVTHENPPVTLIAKVNGKLQTLLVTDKKNVKKGEHLIVIENSSSYKDVMLLKHKLDSFQFIYTKLQTPEYLNIPTPEQFIFSDTLILGELQGFYSELKKNYSEYITFIKAAFHEKKIKSVQNQIEKYQQLSEKLSSQQKLVAEDLAIENQQYNRDSSLYSRGVFAKTDFEKSKANLIQKKYSHVGTKVTIDNTLIQIAQLQQVLLEIEQQYEEQNKAFKIALSQSLDNLKTGLKLWEDTYVLSSPIEGKVSFTKFWSQNQNIQANDKVVHIVPGKSSRIIGKIDLPISGSGKVKINQMVNIKIDNFPYIEYGMLTGKVEAISLVATDNSFSVEVSLPDGFKSNYGKNLQFSNEMKGTAEIITEDMRLIERFLNPIRAILKGNS